MGKSTIEWLNEVPGRGYTWNPVSGCTPCSPGCDNCYAERMARRNAGRNGYPEAPHHFDVTLHPDRLLEPLRWRKPRRVFVCSMGDLFHAGVPDEFLARLWTVMAFCADPKFYGHTFQVLTKRPERMRDFTTMLYGAGEESQRLMRDALDWLMTTGGEQSLWAKLSKPKTAPMGPLSNVWLGVTAENQAQADARIPVLLQCPAVVRFVSIEPGLGPVDLHQCEALPVDPGSFCDSRDPCGNEDCETNPCEEYLAWRDRPLLDWVIAGGETGPGARPMHPDWVRSLRDQCKAAGVPFFFKQWGDYTELPVPSDAKGDGRYRIVEADGKVQVIDHSCRVMGIDSGAALMHRVGKEAAGHLLDGVEHREFPVRDEEGDRV